MAGVTGAVMAGRGAFGSPPATGVAPVSPFARNVLDFGARGNAKTDNTAAFQKALDAVYADGGGIVHIPPGRYLFKGHLTMPANTSLDGVFLAPPAYIHANPVSGTVLLPTEGRGRTDGPPFIAIHGNNCT
ncbi:hypothetical protein B1A_05094, partial [mine drainage metagenome]